MNVFEGLLPSNDLWAEKESLESMDNISMGLFLISQPQMKRKVKKTNKIDFITELLN